MATPSYPQEDNQEKTSLPCCKTLSLEGRWRNQISATLQGSTLGSLDHPAMPTGGGCNLHCDIVTCVWIFATAKRWSKKKTQCKFPLYETDDVEIDILFFGGRDMEFIGQIPPSNHPWASVTSALTQGTVREQLRKNSGPFLSQAKSPPKLCDFLSCFSCFCCGRR